jgi:histidine triad (HIT) family protein
MAREGEAAGCVFCGISRGDIPARIVLEDEDFAAFRDLNPQAPVHVLVVPRKHVGSTGDLGPEDAELTGRLVLAADAVARKLGIASSGYRVVINTGEDGGQTVPHLHLHVLGGRPLSWPPG